MLIAPWLLLEHDHVVETSSLHFYGDVHLSSSSVWTLGEQWSCVAIRSGLRGFANVVALKVL